MWNPTQQSSQTNPYAPAIQSRICQLLEQAAKSKVERMGELIILIAALITFVLPGHTNTVSCRKPRD